MEALTSKDEFHINTIYLPHCLPSQLGISLSGKDLLRLYDKMVQKFFNPTEMNG